MKVKKRILFVITKSVWGGAQKYIVDLASGLDRDSFDVLVASGGQGHLKEKVEKLDLTYFEIPHFERDIRAFADIFSFFEVLYLIFKIKPDIIHVNSSKAGGVCGSAGFIYKILGHKLKMIFTAHGWAFNEKRSKYVLYAIRFFSCLTSFFYDFIICVSDFDFAEALVLQIAPKKKLIRIHNGIETNIPFLPKEEARKALGINTDKIIIGTMAEFVPNKGLDILILCVAELEKTQTNIEAVIIGHGTPSEEKTLYAQKKQIMGTLPIKITPSSPDSYKNLKAFDIFVMPSRKEGLSYALMEASLASLPIITTSVGGNSEIIENGKTGIIIPPENINALASAIKNILAMPDLGKALGIAAADRIRGNFAISTMRKKTYAIYGTN